MSTQETTSMVTLNGTFLEDRDGECSSGAAAQLDLRLLRVVVEALGWLQPVDEDIFALIDLETN